MGLSNFPCPAEGMLPVLVMNTVLSVAGIRNIVRSILQVVGAANVSFGNDGHEHEHEDDGFPARERRVSITRYGSLCRNRAESSAEAESGGCGGGGSAMECCVCLCRFEANEKVSELSCKHFFHTGCLDKWLDNHHTTCPLCRSML